MRNKKGLILFFSTLFILCFSTILYLKFPSYFLQLEDKINNKALFLYRNSDFKIFEDLNQKNRQKLYELYMQRCSYFIKNPPKNFDGIFATTK